VEEGAAVVGRVLGGGGKEEAADVAV